MYSSRKSKTCKYSIQFLVDTYLKFLYKKRKTLMYEHTIQTHIQK